MADYEVPTKAHLLAFAEKIASEPEDLLESEYYDYSEDINELLLELREGDDLTDEVREELSDLYDEWESDGFPVAEEDEDAVQEGGPKTDEGDEEEDPDLLPAPADV